jgi:hypothetical protein
LDRVKSLTPAFTNAFSTPDLRRSVSGVWAGQIAVIGFVAGHSFLPNVWLHLGWLLLAGVPAMAWTDWTPHLKRWQADAGALAVMSFLLWMTLRSCIQIPFMSGHSLDEAFRGIVGAVLLVMFCALVWQQAQSRESLRSLGWVTGMTSAFAALISIALCFFVLPNHYAGERLTNLLVHGGLNPVCTGLIFGFSALWLAASVENKNRPVPGRIAWAAITLLHFAAFLSGSRGAMLALACGHAVLLAARGWRRGRMAVCVFLLTGTIYFTSGPLLIHTMPWRAAPATATVTHAFETAVKRGDNGRLEIYRAGWHAMDNLWLGTGQWGSREVWQCELQAKTDISMMSHLHSACFATFVHGGIIGATLLLVMLGCGIKRACRLAVQGEATWIALLAFGCSGLLFDGESLTSLATAPRFEGLLFWLPLTVALARGSATAQRSDS